MVTTSYWANEPYECTKENILWFKSSRMSQKWRSYLTHFLLMYSQVRKSMVANPCSKSNGQSYDKSFISNSIRIAMTVWFHISFFLEIMPCCQASLHPIRPFCEHRSLKFLFWVQFNRAVDTFMSPTSFANCRPCRRYLRVWNNQKLHGDKLGLYSGWVMVRMLCFSRHSGLKFEDNFWGIYRNEVSISRHP